VLSLFTLAEEATPAFDLSATTAVQAPGIGRFALVDDQSATPKFE
jgi:hypothetical protein